MAEITDPMSLITPGGFEYGLGAGWLPYYNQLAQLITAQGASQGAVGNSLVDNLTTLLTNPTGGPLGLAATAAYGGPQGIAAGTKGAGIDMSKPQSIYDTLLQHLTGYVKNIDAPPSAAPIMGAAKGGDMTLQGQPHFVVDSSGYPVAALTEDGKPEKVSGIGGIEVTPLDPARKKAYEAKKEKVDPNKAPMMTPEKAAKAPDGWGKMIADHEAAVQKMMPGYTDGGVKSLLPFPTTVPALTTVPGGPNQPFPVPTTGGPTMTRAEQVGPYFQPKLAGTFEDLMASITPGAGETYGQRYAKLLGGALSATNQAFNPESLRSLNLGLAPNKLPSANVWATLDSSMRDSYASYLQQLGISRSPQDLASQINRFRPASLE